MRARSSPIAVPFREFGSVTSFFTPRVGCKLSCTLRKYSRGKIRTNNLKVGGGMVIGRAKRILEDTGRYSVEGEARGEEGSDGVGARQARQ